MFVGSGALYFKLNFFERSARSENWVRLVVLKNIPLEAVS